MICAMSRTLPVLLLLANTGQAQEVLPERSTAVQLSNRDVNRVHCPLGITEVHWSKEKPVAIEQQSENVYVKFLVRRVGMSETRTTDPVDIHVVCGGDVYTLIVHPRDLDAQTIRLGDSRRQDLLAASKEWGALPLEEFQKVIDPLTNPTRHGGMAVVTSARQRS